MGLCICCLIGDPLVSSVVVALPVANRSEAPDCWRIWQCNRLNHLDVLRAGQALNVVIEGPVKLAFPGPIPGWDQDKERAPGADR